ncbi:MAG: low molecular weight protein-tyrosine-phosphatase [Gemmatimonadota bacterium]
MHAEPSSTERTSVLFVCLGNICRSPLAEGVFRSLVEEAGLSDRFEIASAGTGGWHVGETPDSRATMVASRYGVTLDSKARQVTEEDLAHFDYVIAMDRDNLAVLERMAADTGAEAELHLLREFDPAASGDEVPDPYYGGASGFETVYEMVHRSCEALLAHILDRR